MLCLDCGIHFPPGRTACAVCGSDLRDAARAVLVPAQPVRSERDPLEDSLWPPPTVFILDDKDDVLEVPGSPTEVFEDAQADDVFEQSLSGVKLEDLVEEEEKAEAEDLPELTFGPSPVEPEAPGPPAVPGPVAVQPAEVGGNVISEPPVTKGFFEPRGLQPSPIAPPVPAADVVEPPPPAPARTSGGKFLRTLAAVMTLGAVFAAGAASGFWYADANSSAVEAAPLVAEPPAESEQGIPTPPEGMAYVAGGDFLMGSDDGEVLSRPAHFVSVRPFFIDRTEVTNEQYRRFVEATGYDPPPGWKDGAVPPGEETLPVTGVTWYDAAAFAAWAGKRLPTESEWEFAARGSDGRKYPWGNEWNASLANLENRSAGLARAGETAASPQGIHDLAGNAWEWTASDARPYPGGKEFPRSRLKLKIIRGGNWKSNSETAAATFRGYYGASGEKDYSSTSFRCVKDIAN